MKTLRVGLIGAGGISYPHAAAWRSMGADVRVWSEAGADGLVKTFGFRPAASLDELLSQSDLVDICTPTFTHADLALRAIDAGLHVICEKPLTRHAADARAVIDAAEARGVQVYPGHVVRYFPEYAAVHAAVEAGHIGTPAVLRFSRGSQAPASDWFFDDRLSGGILLDQMIHDLDQARWLAGEVLRVSASIRRGRGDESRMTLAHVVLTHASGAISMVQGSWGPVGVEFVTSLDVAGSTGRLEYDSSRHHDVEANLGTRPGGSSYLPALSGENPYEAELRDFVGAFAGGPAPRVTAYDGLIAIGIAEAALESARRGEAVDVDEQAIGTETPKVEEKVA